MAKKTNFTNPSGKEYFRTSVSIGFDENGKRKRKYFYGISKRDAERLKQEYLEGLSNKRDGIIDTTLNAYMQRWLFDVVKVEVKHSSFNRYEGLYRNYIKDTSFSNCILNNINTSQVQQHYNLLSSKGASPATIEIINRLLNKMFNYCVKIDMLECNPCNHIALPKKYEIKKEIIVFKKDEIEKIKKSVDDDITNFIYLLALSTGLRAGEIFALTYRDIDLNKLIINVNKTLGYVTVVDENRSNREVLITPPKSENSIRIVPLPYDLVLFFKNHKEYEKEKAFTNYVSFSDDNLVFTSTKSKPRNSKQLNLYFKRFLKSIDLPYRKFHTLRHTYCSILAINNVPLKMAAELMGHDVEMTSKIYTHLDLDSKTQAISKINFF